MKQTKSVESWLKELPESIRPEIEDEDLNIKVDCLSDAFLCCYWNMYDDNLFNMALYESLKWAEEG